METPGYIEQLRIVGGDPALDFVNTEDGDPPMECLRGYGDLVAWSVRAGLFSADEGERLVGEADRRPEDAEAVYHEALRLRGALQDVFRTVGKAGMPPNGVWGPCPAQAVRRLLLGLSGRQQKPQPSLVHHGGLWHGRKNAPLRRKTRRQARVVGYEIVDFESIAAPFREAHQSSLGFPLTQIWTNSRSTKS